VKLFWIQFNKFYLRCHCWCLFFLKTLNLRPYLRKCHVRPWPVEDRMAKRPNFKLLSFYARASIAIARISYGNSVRLFVTTRYQSKTRWDRDFGFSPYDSLLSLVFHDKISSRWVKGIPLNEGAKEGSPSLISVILFYIGSSNVKMVADRHRHAAYHNKHWRRAS